MAGMNETVTHVNTVCAADFRDDGVCRMSDRPYDVRLYKKKMLDQVCYPFHGFCLFFFLLDFLS